MEGIDSFRVMFLGSILVTGLMAIFEITGWLFSHFPKLLAVAKAASSFQIPVYALISVFFLYIRVLAPIIRYFIPRPTVEAEAERPSPAPELSDEQRAAEARRCQLPGAVCDSIRTRLESKTREVTKLVRELGEAEQRELDANDAAEAHRNSHKIIRQRLDQTEGQLVRYNPEAMTIRKLEILLAESEKKFADAEKRVETGERLLKAEVEHSKWAVEKKERQISKIKEDMVSLVQRAKDRIGVLNAKVNSLEYELDAAKRKDMSANVVALLAERDETIQFLTEAGLAVEKDRDEKMAYAETMYASLQAENEHLRQQLTDSTERTRSDNDAARSLRDDLANAKAQVQTAEAVFYEKEKTIGDLENQLKKVTDESETIVTDANNLKAKLSAANEKMVSGVTKENIEGLNRQLDELRNQVADAHSIHDSKMSEASAIHAEQQKYIESLRENMNAASIENANMRQDISRLQELLDQHAASGANSSSAIEQRIAGMQHQHQADMNEAKSMLETKDGEIKHLQDSLVGTKTHIASLQEEVDEMQGCVDEQDEHIVKLERKLHKALINEKKGIERFAELEEKRKKEASADLLKYNRFKVEYNKRLGSLLAKTLNLMATRDLESELKEQIETMTRKTGNKHAGANTSTKRQNDPKTNRKQTQI
ncbi:hypothetical protein CGRA01v4_00042 [Colletotrichum graminicola]|uniref:Uncharacterized protein n=1 Tax=Colletotrichum graminicola (strain M1.001 / M2 / FGSC 10212) TaxID=645133 RepID=E3QXA4_COLGM|nr:uncharacterized protein GLRG_10636 [Colletotrichum graminicola M1.001]EFQ35492.1 hypothetical protein GLRG_10636 [Colletotrichum graminicola M1.001]WDK08764.1 hypothetical protein CGRA01v4_00042 [Colletotrichum graminicola]